MNKLPDEDELKKKSNEKLDRLQKALRENLLKRKQQQRLRNKKLSKQLNHGE